MIRLRSLGDALITTPVTKLGPSNEVAFAAGLYLVLERGKRIGRRTLEELLWPALPDNDKTRHRFRQTIHKLRVSGFPIEANRTYVELPAELVETDFDGLEDASKSGNGPAFDNLTFLPGYNPKFSTSYAHWLDAKRDLVNVKCAKYLTCQIRSAKAHGDWEAVDRLALACSKLDPFNEEVVLARAEAVAMRGAKLDALAIIDAYLAEMGPGAGDVRLPASVMRRRIAENQPLHKYLPGDAPFIGRTQELAILHRLVASASMSCGRISLIVGEPGSGKSRLVREIAQYSSLQGASVLRVQAHPTDIDRPLSAFVELIPILLTMRGAIGCEKATLEALSRLTRDDHPETRSRVSGVDAEVQYATLRKAIIDLFGAITDERCVVVVIEDIHWLDNESARILGELGEWSVDKRLLTVMTSRVPKPDWTAFHGSFHSEIVTLTALAISECEAMVRALIPAGVSGSCDALLTWCLPLCEGNPFFLHELTRHWLETRGSQTLPPSIAEVIEARLSRLRPETQLLLQVCALLGRHSTLPRIEQVLGVSPDKLLQSLNELSDANMLALDRGGHNDEEETVFSRHDLLSIAVLDRISPVARRFIHRRIGQVLEGELTIDRSSSILWDCADHWQKAGDRVRAVGLVRSCANHLSSLGLFDDSGSALVRALSYSNNPQEKLAILAELISVAHSASNWIRMKQAADHYQSIASGLTSSTSSHSEIELLGLEAAWRAQMDWADMLERVQSCVNAPEADPSHRVRAAVLALKLAGNLAANSTVDSVSRSVQDIISHESIAERDRLEFAMIVASERRDYEAAFRAANRFAAYERMNGTPVSTICALRNAARVSRLAGSQTDAIVLLQEAFDICETYHLKARQALVMLSLAETYNQMGDLEAAEYWAGQMSPHNFPSVDAHALREWRTLCARLALQRGRPDEAEQLYPEAVRSTDSDQSALRRAASLALIIRIRIAQEAQVPDIERLVNRLLELHMVVRSVIGQDFETAALVLGLGFIGNMEAARQILRDFLRYRSDREPMLPELQRTYSDYGITANMSGTPISLLSASS